MEVWVITAENVMGQRLPTGIAHSEAAAYRVAEEALDALTLSLSIGASQAQKEAAERIFDSIRIQRARLELLDG